MKCKSVYCSRQLNNNKNILYRKLLAHVKSRRNPSSSCVTGTNSNNIPVYPTGPDSLLPHCAAPQAQLYRYPPCKSGDLDPLWHFLLSHSSFPRWYEPGDRRPNLNHQDCGNHPGGWDVCFIFFVQSILVGNCTGQSTRIHLIGCLRVGNVKRAPMRLFLVVPRGWFGYLWQS